MTVSASFFSYLTASWCDVDVVLEPTGGEIIGMPETIPCLCRVFADESGRRVAIVADGYSSMARLQPATILLLHDMAINAGFCVIRHIRVTASVDEGVRADTQGQAKGDAQNNPLRHAKLHYVSSRHAGAASPFNSWTVSPKVSSSSDDILRIGSSICPQDLPDV